MKAATAHTRRKQWLIAQTSKVISWIFDPLVLIPVGLIAFGVSLLFGNHTVELLLLIALVDLILPVLVLTYLIKSNHIRSGWDITNRHERIPFFIIIILCQTTGLFIALQWGTQLLIGYTLAFWILTVLFGLITLFWKISIHTAVASTLVTMAVLFVGYQWFWLYAIVFIVLWARVAGKYHRLWQAVWGAALPMIVLPFLFRLFDLI